MPSFTVGLDLGQSRDPSALVVVERIEHITGYTEPDGPAGQVWPETVDHYYVRRIQRWLLGTPYPAVVGDVCELFAEPALEDAMFRFDATGVGRAIADLFIEAYRDERLGTYWPRAITITSGAEADGNHVPKTDLVAALQRLLQEGRLHVDPALPLADKLRQELADFRIRISDAGRASFGAVRESAHDDLTIALMLAVFRPHHETPRIRKLDGQLVDPIQPLRRTP